MKKQLRKIFILVALLAAFTGNAFAVDTYQWTNIQGNNLWTDKGNWLKNAVTADSYPGLIATDIVQIGVGYHIPNNPLIYVILPAGTYNIESLTIGDNSNTNGVQNVTYLDIRGILNISGTFMQMHSDNRGFTGNGTDFTYPPNFDFHIETWLWGVGTLNCNRMQIGDGTPPLPDNISNVTRFKMATPNGSKGLGLHVNVATDYVLHSISRNDPTTNKIISVSSVNSTLVAGFLTVGGQMILENENPVIYVGSQYQPQARFTMEVTNNNNTGGEDKYLYLKGANALSIPGGYSSSNQLGSNIFTFWYVRGNSTPAQVVGLGQSFVVYSGDVDQKVYTNKSFTQTNGLFSFVGGNYQNLILSGAGKKTFDATDAAYPLYVSGDINVAAGTTVDLNTNNPKIILSDGSNIGVPYNAQGPFPYNYSTYTLPALSNFSSGAGSSFTNGSIALTIPGTTTNGGTFNTSASTVTLAGTFTNSGIFNQTGAGTVTASTTTSNSGTYNQNGTGALTFTGTFTNSGIFNQTGAGTVTASNATSNSGTYSQNGTGALTFTGAVDNSGTINDINTGVIAFNNTFNNSSASAVFNQSNGTINFNNGYTNTGTFKATAGNTYLNQSGDQSLTDNSAAVVGNSINPPVRGTTFYNVFVQNGGTKTLSGSGQFYVASNGFLNMVSTTNLATGNILTLNSDVTGSATVPAIPSDCNITGNVTVQRYISANRAYRLISSPVYTGSDGTNNTYRVNYLMNNTYLTGTDGTGGGFSKPGNPTLYLYRENLAPLYTTFLNSNFKGIKNIATSPYLMDDADYPSANLPVGNGVLFYYRGSSKQATLGALTTVGAAATTDTLNAVGVLNQGNVTVHNWYTPGSANLGNTTASGDPNIQGFNLVGNPYASSIDWDKYSTSVGTGITAPNVSPFSYQLIPTGLPGAGTYNVYLAGTFDHKGTTGTDNSNVIASGEGFFVQALNASAQLTFNESAKTNTVVTGANLYMGKPVATNTPSYLRLQLAMDSINTEGIIINFNDNANTAFNIMEDARYKTGTGKVNLASLSSDRVPLSINQLPLSKDQIIALNVSATTDGTYKLNSKAIAGIPQLYNVWLMDAFKKDSVNLRTTATYSFTIAKSDTNTFGSKRFKLVINQNPALAVQLLSFTAGKVNNKPQVEVVWKAVNEQNYTHYTVERSTNKGTTFEVVGGLTSSGQGTYSLLDKNAVNGINQYRLRQEDLNSKITYSNVVTIQYSDKSNNQAGNSHLSVYPNPAINHINLTIDPKNQVAAYSIKITNSVGAVVKQAVTTQPSWQDNVSNLLTGTYLIQVVNNKDNSLVGQTKFVKL